MGRASGWHYGDVWSSPVEIDGNIARQLHVPAGLFETVSGDEDALSLSNCYGSWPASTADRPLLTDGLWVTLPIGTKAGSEVPKLCTWNRPVEIGADKPTDVLATYSNAIRFDTSEQAGIGFRSPQLGAMHAVLGYWTTNRPDAVTVVMPTGTGKTETMLGLLVAARLERLLVVVPSDALREQIAAKFDRLGILQEISAVEPFAKRPVVGRLRHSFSSSENALAFANTCNVVVTTPSALHASEVDVSQEFLGRFSHLFVDEAHHVAAGTWTRIRDEFKGKRVVQFTATPYREDGKHLQGIIVYSFPLREAQAQELFSKIDFKSVVDFEDPDRAVATAALTRLRADLKSGYDHVLMARVNTIARAKSLLALYESLAADVGVVAIYSQLSETKKRESDKALKARTARVVVCVDMLGEGFDLPALKVAAVHDSHKSLGVTLQFIGRFARTSASGKYGPASMFVVRKEFEADPRLRQLYSEDVDWNTVLRDISETAADEQRQISEFEEGFGSRPEAVALQSLLPKMSTVVYRTPSSEWDPMRCVEFFGEDQLLTNPIGLNANAGVAWMVVQRRSQVQWADLRTVEELAYELYVLYFDSERRLLYINNSANDGVFEELANTVAGPGAIRYTGSAVYRVMADVRRLVPTNVGVLDSRSHFRRFSMHVGADVTESFTDVEAGTKTQTNISGTGYRDGERVNIGASRKGRIWSHAAATSLKQWCDWCDGIGAKLLDETVTIEHVIGNFIIPEPLSGRPDGVLLGVEWPWEIHLQTAEAMRLQHQERVFEAVYCDLIPDIKSTSGPFRFTISNDAWKVGYEVAIDEDGRFTYSCIDSDEVMVLRRRSEQPLSEWLNSNSLILILDGDRLIEDGLLYAPKWDRPPFDPSRLVAVDWTGIDLKREAQKEAKHPASIQRRAIELLLTEGESAPWTLIIDDDGPGEIADIVALRVDEDGLLVRLVHCKYSSGDKPGGRVEDLYEVCGQAQKSVAWRRSDLAPFFKELSHRAQRKYQRTHVSPFEVGDEADLLRLQAEAQVLRRRMEIVIVQPGLSMAKVSPQQLDLLSAAESYLQTSINASLTVWCSEE
ncbi:DEAD/DEAH box helicase [Mycobacteroides abscessus]